MTTQITKIVRPLDPQAVIEAHVKAITDVHGVGASEVESKAGAQAKVDTHGAATQTHGASGSYRLAISSRADQLPAWVDIPDKPSTFTPSPHAHASTDITGVPAARVYHDAAQSIANRTHVVLAFNSERFDTDSIHDVSTNNSRLSCRTPGIYQISASVAFAQNGTAFRTLWIRLNGGVDIAHVIFPAIASAVTRVTVSTLYALSDGDYVEAVVYQDSGGALNVESIANYSPEFMMVRVG